MSGPTVVNRTQSKPVFALAFTQEKFVEWINYRRETETLAAIARSLGVSVMAICRWRDGVRRPSRPILLLAEYVMTYKKLPEIADNLG
jgi:hypothetical protein